MKKTLLLFFCVGCLTSNEPSSDTDTEYWICHNLESEEHGNVCSDSCYESGNEHKFCWFLLVFQLKNQHILLTHFYLTIFFPY